MNYKSKRAKATAIPQEVKEKVLLRDDYKCIICGKAGIPNAHYIRRSQRRTWHRAKHRNTMSSLPLGIR